MKYKQVIFDCDGTIIDTIADVAYCLNKALETCGFAICPIEVISSLIGKPLETIVRGLLEYGLQNEAIEYSPFDIERIVTIYKTVYDNYEKPLTAPFAGITELIDDLLERGVAVAVNSNKPEIFLTALIRRCFPGREIRVCGYANDFPAKPDPAGALALTRDLGIAVEESVYVGDTQVDFETASNADMDCIIITWGQGTCELYSQPSLAACCRTVEELRKSLLR